VGLLAATAALYLIGLSRNGWANDFYAAAVQAGTKSWKAMFLGSFDASNFITVDKPPASLWVMEISGRIFGVNSWSLLVPQALEGVAAAWLLYAAVKRWFGPGAGLLAGQGVGGDPDVVLDGQVGEQPPALRDDRDPGAPDPLRPPARELTAVQEHGSRLRPEHAANGQHQARLPSAVRPEQGGHLAGRYRDRDVADHGASAALDGEAAQAEHVGPRRLGRLDRLARGSRRFAHSTSAVPR